MFSTDPPINRWLPQAHTSRTSELTYYPAVTTGNVMSMEELANVKGRGWEDIDVRGATLLLTRSEKLTPTTALGDYCIVVSTTRVWNNRSSDRFAYICTAPLCRLGTIHYTRTQFESCIYASLIGLTRLFSYIQIGPDKQSLSVI
jgi:hypothetical protein